MQDDDWSDYMAVNDVKQSTRRPPPLWLPEHEDMAVAHGACRPAGLVKGYSVRSGLVAWLIGSRWKTTVTVATAIAVLAYVVTLPSLAWIGAPTLVKLTILQAWSLAVLLAVTRQVRSVSIPVCARYWLAGMFVLSVVSRLVAEPVASIGFGGVSILAPLEDLFKMLVLGIAIVVGRRAWRHPGLSDLMVLGFCVGAGYSFVTAGAWEEPVRSSLGWGPELFFPSIWQLDSAVVAGHAIWTSVAGFAIGLLLLHRHQPAAVAGAAALLVLVVADHLSVTAGAGSLDFVRQLLFDGSLTLLLFFVALACSVGLDLRRQKMAAERDHLFPNADSRVSRVIEPNEYEDLVRPLLASRYRRLRNGVYNTVNATPQLWPPRSQQGDAPLAELARYGRAADVAVGPGASASGWVAESGAPNRWRFLDQHGTTDYLSQRGIAVGLDWLSEPENKVIDRPKDYWQHVGLAMVAAALYVLVRLVTASDHLSEVVDTGLSFGLAPSSPNFILLLVGSLATLLSLRGRDAPVPPPSWEIGPTDDPIRDRPLEYEA